METNLQTNLTHKESYLEFGVSMTPTVWLGGVVSGLQAGCWMMIAAIAYSYIIGVSAWALPQAMAAVFLDHHSLTGGLGITLLGVLIHLGVSASFGALFSVLVNQYDTFNFSILWGLVYSVFIWLVMSYLIIPIFDPVLRVFIQPHQGAWFFAHLIFGAALVLTPYLERRYEMAQRFLRS